MSSFICSGKHFKKVKDLTYKLILSDRYILYDFNMSYDTADDDIEAFINNNIYNLYKVNVASVNCQYNEKSDCRVYESYDKEIGYNIKKPMVNKIYIDELISLYNAYDCINYQIELDYNKNFINIIQKHIGKNIVRILNDLPEYENINKWQFR